MGERVCARARVRGCVRGRRTRLLNRRTAPNSGTSCDTSDAAAAVSAEAVGDADALGCSGGRAQKRPKGATLRLRALRRSVGRVA